MKKSKLKINDTYQWKNFFDGYLEIANTACNSISDIHISLKKEDQKKVKGAKEKIEKLYFPILFNIRHSIEVLLKTLIFVSFEKKYVDESNRTHDIEELFNEIKDKISVSDMQGEIEKFCQIIEADDMKVYFKKAKEKMPSFWKDLESIVKKYVQLDFLKDKILNNYSIYDFENTAFKYPTNNLSIQLDYANLIKNVDIKDIIEIIKDVRKLEEIGFWLWYALDSLVEDKKTKRYDKK